MVCLGAENTLNFFDSTKGSTIDPGRPCE